MDLPISYSPKKVTTKAFSRSSRVILWSGWATCLPSYRHRTALKLNEGVVHGVLFLDDQASAIAYYREGCFQFPISVLVRVTGFEPSITSIKSRVPYLSATRAYYGGKPRYRPEHLGVADHCLTSWLVYHLAPKERLELPHAHT